MARDGASALPPRPDPPSGGRTHPGPQRDPQSRHYQGTDKRDRQGADTTPKEFRTLDIAGEVQRDAATTEQSFVRRSVPNSRVVLALLDLVLIGGAKVIVFSQIYQRLDLLDFTQVAVIVGMSLLITMALLYAVGCYRRDTMVDPVVATSRLPPALGFAGLVLFLILHYGMPIVSPGDPVYLSISRCLTVVLIGSSIALCAALTSRVLFYAMVRHHWFRRRILVIGTGKRALHVNQLMAKAAHRLTSELSFAPESIIGGSAGEAWRSLRNPSLAKSMDSIDAFVCEYEADEIVVAADEEDELSLECLLRCKTNGIPITDYHAFLERETGRVDLTWLEMSWLIYSKGFRVRQIDAFFKRSMDVLCSAFMLLISFPVLALAIVAIKLEGRGPIFYRQQRVTKNDRVFWLYKLRTMHTEAERHGPKWAGQDDPRITAVGLRLRRYHIDEIPQLLNVLMGDMSLVGPRPERPHFVEQLRGEIPLYDLRHSMRAGVTGWAQINYRYGASVSDALRKQEYDIYYIKNYSVIRDIKILLQTMRVVLWPGSVHVD